MLLSKANLYAEPDQMTSFYARAYTHPARLLIIRSLRKQEPRTVQELSIFHPLTLPAMSQHLEIFRIVRFQPHYPFLLYSIDDEHYNQARESMIRFLNED